jgi:hypothetical protein
MTIELKGGQQLDLVVSSDRSTPGSARCILRVAPGPVHL